MEEYIKLKKRNTLRVGIMDEEGNVKLDHNGKEVYIEFDLEDINLPVNYSKCDALIKKSSNTLKMKTIAINKREDVKGKGIMSKNEEDIQKALKDYYKSVETAMDMFLGLGATRKIFGNRRYLTMWDDLNEYLQPILPKLQINFESISEQIKKKYASKEDNVLRNE